MEISDISCSKNMLSASYKDRRSGERDLYQSHVRHTHLLPEAEQVKSESPPHPLRMVHLKLKDFQGEGIQKS